MSDNAYSARRLIALGGIASFLVFALLVGWGAGATISGAVIAPGRIEIDVNRQVVQSQSAGVVTDIRARNGALVAPGDLLIQLDSSDARSELAVVTAQMNELAARKARLIAERDDAPGLLRPNSVNLSEEAETQFEGQRRLFKARHERHLNAKIILRRQMSEIESRISGLNAQKAALRDQSVLVDREEGMQSRLLAQGLTEASRLLAIRRELARIRGEIGRLTAEIAASRARLASIEAENVQLDRARHETAIENLRDLEFREMELAERRKVLLTAIERSSVRSPVSGLVHEASIHSLGAFVQPGDILMYIVPSERPLVANVRVEATKIDQVFEGQQARLRLAAMDPRRAPDIEGHVTNVSADSVQNLESGAVYYLVRIEPAQSARASEVAGMMPGMSVDAFISTGSQAPIQYLIRPLTEYFDRAFRDG